MKHPVIINSRGAVVRRDKYDRNSIISQLLSSTSARQQLAQSMIAPIRARLDYQGLARKAFTVQQMPGGAVPVYDSDLVSDIIVKRFKYDTIKINSRGNVYRKGSLSGAVRRVTFPTFQLVSNPTIKMSEVKRRRFGITDRAVNKLKQSMMAEEDSRIFEALDEIGKNG